MTRSDDSPAAVQAAIAAHRFGLGEPTLSGIGSDAQDWLLAQTGPAEPQRGSNLVTGAEGLQRHARQQQQRRAKAVAATGAMSEPAATAQAQGDSLRTLLQADVRARCHVSQHERRPAQRVPHAGRIARSLGAAAGPAEDAGGVRHQQRAHRGAR